MASILSVYAFQIKLDYIEQIDSTVFESIISLLKSFKEYSIIPIFFIPICYHFYKYVFELTRFEKNYVTLSLAICFSFFIIMGYSYDSTGSWSLVINADVYQCIKALIAFVGYIIFFYVCITYIFYKFDTCDIYSSVSEKKVSFFSRYFKCLKNKPFITTFITLFIIYIPYMVLSYPAIFGYDTVNQIIQAYPEVGAYSPYYTRYLATKEGIYLNNHHPVAHTLLIHMCLKIGTNLFSSYNIGIFIFAIVQLVVMLLSISLLVQLLFQLQIAEKYIFMVILYYIISPRIQAYMFFITKDVFFAAFSLIFVITLYKIISNNEKKKDLVLFVVSALGTILFRNDGKYLVILSLILVGIIYKKVFKKVVLFTVAFFIFTFVYSSIILPGFHIIPGSIKEVLSIPFQQTARYLRDSSTPITEEEKDAISAVLDYNFIIENYDPELSDYVKDSYNVNATKDDLVRYFKVWFQMFLKHPSHYIQATMNNYYYYFYPGSQMAGYYSYHYSVRNMDIANSRGEKVEMNFYHPEQLRKYQEIYEQFRESIANMPIFSALISSATYNWILFILVFWGMKKRCKQAIAISIPLLMQLLISIAGPCNGAYFRYTYPIAISLPAIVFIFLHFVKENDR